MALREKITTSDSYYKIEGKESFSNCLKFQNGEQRFSQKQVGKPKGFKDFNHGKSLWSGLPPTLGRAGSSRIEKMRARKRSSEEGHRADALALRADERRDKLRKASGRSTYPLIRRSLNGETRLSTPQPSVHESIVCGGELGELKHLSTRRKRKKYRFRQ